MYDRMALETLHWVKSSFSGGAENCVEVAYDATGWRLRDSKNPTGPTHHFTHTQWTNFLHHLRRDRLG
ncbi:protein of unknown function [Actinopolyspora xinjiangensis]|uniref:DUF397 domain-containing protein n=1 Tax=Actinopolyspora xinjiangensis TaxID=405564 RepID=A0A1H0QEF9_9ACTN|nr:DUF397 domain-containing protein [Actinopolyspora xinjiangensis]SDP15076.1 protein of unknown function [Actinopolyspora xinjiangensis]